MIFINKYYLRFPNIDDETNYIQYQKEEHFVDLNFNQWLNEKIVSSKQKGKINGKVPTTVLLLTDNEGIIYGQCSIRHSIDSVDLSNYIGHIGYEIKKEYRGNGLGNLILKLALDYCRNMELKKVMISCREDNILSAKVIEKNNGVLERITYIDKEKSNYKVYWISL